MYSQLYEHTALLYIHIETTYAMCRKHSSQLLCEGSLHSPTSNVVQTSKASKYCHANALTVVRQKKNGNMAESELLCVRVAPLLRSKYASILRVMAKGNSCQNCQDFYFIVLDICHALTITQAKNIAIALAITLVRSSWRANPVLICDVICRCHLYDCEMWCSRELYFP